ncbi:MAG: GerMN domain-containing protein [Clostridia bacterium]|nr:GerMN domain-containing protein [Clostridia bacterium]
MNFSGNQRRMYLLSLVLLIAAIVLVCVWSVCKGSGNPSQFSGPSDFPVQEAEPSLQPEIIPTSPPAAGVSASADASGSAQKENKVSTIVYYQDNYGYLVPVMCSVPMEDGIAKATLGMMVKSAGNDMQAARLGLRTVLPENTKIDLDISGGVARIDLSKEVLDMADAAAETNMVNAVVQTLTEFESVKKVRFLIDGQEREKLTHGTSVAGDFTRGSINMELAEATMGSDSAKPVTLYFPADSGAVIVPVTRMVHANADINTAVLELAKGPSNENTLEEVVPSGCGLIDVKVENGVAKLNFTGEFLELVHHSDGGRMALKALVLTCTQFDGVKSVEIYVDGKKYDLEEGELGIPTFVNVADTIVYDYIQTQSAMIFDFE